MTPEEIRAARQKLGLSVAEFARWLETDAQTVRRMEFPETASTFRKPAVRMERLIDAYLEGYRPAGLRGTSAG